MPRTLINNGRVTSRDSSMRAEGEVAEAQDCYYEPANPGLKSILGRVAFNSSAEASALVGGGFLEFDTATALIVTLRDGGTVYRKATAGATGSFSDLAGFDASSYALAGTAETFDQAHYRDQHILVNGVDRPRVVSSAGTQMFLGMLETTAPPTIARDGHATGAGFTLAVGEVRTYWIEEQVRVAGVIVKRSSPNATALATLTGDATVDHPRITKPATLNPDTTHWAVYATAVDVDYPIGAEVGSAAVGTTTIDDLETQTGLPDGTAFSTVVVSILGITTTVAKYGPPPIGSTIDTYADSLVMNDVASKGQVAFCFTDDIHAWPSIFRVKFDTKYHDEVRAVRAFDNFCLVWLNSGVWRINTLPKSTDQTFETERAKAEVEGAIGIVNGKALAKFSFGEGMRVAYVSPTGQIVVTDGSRWNTISNDMATAELDLTQLSASRLINNVRDYRMEWVFVPTGATRPTKTAFLHYHPSHAKSSDIGGLRAKMTWPISRDANDTFLVRINGVDEVFSCNQDGRVYRHDSGASEPTGGTITMHVKTGDDYPGDIGTDATLRELWVHHQAAAGQRATVRVTGRNSSRDDWTTSTEILLDRREATPCGLQQQAEAFQYTFEAIAPTSQVTLDYFAADLDFAGKTEEK